MKTVALYLLIFMFIKSLTFLNQKHPTLRIESEYQKYVTLFEQEANNYGHPMHITDLIVTSDDDLGGTIVAQCRTNHISTPRIVVSLKYWDGLNDAEKEQVFVHEMGHCVLNRGHISTEDADGIPISIMYPYVLPSYVYIARRSEYLKELFSK
jgi:Zn-dependent protease with chaperone function